jgi:hypothetical protein
VDWRPRPFFHATLVLKVILNPCTSFPPSFVAEKPGKDALSCLLLGSIQTACTGGSPPENSSTGG